MLVKLKSTNNEQNKTLSQNSIKIIKLESQVKKLSISSQAKSSLIQKLTGIDIERSKLTEEKTFHYLLEEMQFYHDKDFIRLRKSFAEEVENLTSMASSLSFELVTMKEHLSNKLTDFLDLN
mmetsp:Transcript_32309/g.28621  ORF Transcript_32309/g.28621 Transcript_32309/m.28621 type:complete len:122 (-) Transcript_32309:379-744(-)